MIASNANKQTKYTIHCADVMARMLLGDKYEKTPRQLRRPRHLGTKDQYDRRALLRRLHYADTTLRNTNARLPPRLERILSAYRNALILLLDKAQYDALKRCNQGIHRAMYWNQVLEFDRYSEKEETRTATTPPKESEHQWEQRLQDAILAYQRMAFWLRHGPACPDSWAEIPGELDIIAEAACIKEFARDNPTTPRSRQNDKIIEEIANTCLRIGISPTSFLGDLEHFRDTGLPREGLRKAADRMCFKQIAFILHTDYKNAEFIVKYGAYDELRALRQGIKFRVELYFENFDEELENWTKWVGHKKIRDAWDIRQNKEHRRGSSKSPVRRRGKLREVEEGGGGLWEDEEREWKEAEDEKNDECQESPPANRNSVQPSQKKQRKGEIKRAAVERKVAAIVPLERPSTPALTRKFRSKFEEVHYKPWNSSHVVERSRYDFKDAYECPQFGRAKSSQICC